MTNSADPVRLELIFAHADKARAFAAVLPLRFSSERYILEDMLVSIPADLLAEITDHYVKLNQASQEFIADLFTAYFDNPHLNNDGQVTVTASKISAACHVAHVFTTHLGKRIDGHEVMAYVESVMLNVSHAFRMPVETINWDEREVNTYLLGTALVVAAGRKDATSFENVLWLGRNSEKLIPLIDRIAEVSAQRSYLQPLLEDITTPLNRGAL